MNEPLNLTEENRADIRALVTRLTADLPKSNKPEKQAQSYEDWSNDFAAIVRRSFTSQLVTQIYQNNSLTKKLLEARTLAPPGKPFLTRNQLDHKINELQNDIDKMGAVAAQKALQRAELARLNVEHRRRMKGY